MKRVRTHQGFTLIELMVVVGIVGILSTIAVPVFQKSVLRAKVTERRMIAMRIKQSVQDFYVRTGASVPASCSPSCNSGWNPPLPPGPARRAMLTSLANWNAYFSGQSGSSLHAELEGGFYYSYWFNVAETAGGNATITIIASGDLDADGKYSQKRWDWTRTSGTYELVNEDPPADGEDDLNPDPSLQTF